MCTAIVDEPTHATSSRLLTHSVKGLGVVGVNLLLPAAAAAVRTGEVEENKLYVAGLTPTVQEHALRELFGRCGQSYASACTDSCLPGTLQHITALMAECLA
jgi:hypothetical protein